MVNVRIVRMRVFEALVSIRMGVRLANGIVEASARAGDARHAYVYARESAARERGGARDVPLRGATLPLPSTHLRLEIPVKPLCPRRFLFPSKQLRRISNRAKW
jgi:hypothetical protein